MRALLSTFVVVALFGAGQPAGAQEPVNLREPSGSTSGTRQAVRRPCQRAADRRSKPKRRPQNCPPTPDHHPVNRQEPIEVWNTLRSFMFLSGPVLTLPTRTAPLACSSGNHSGTHRTTQSHPAPTGHRLAGASVACDYV